MKISKIILEKTDCIEHSASMAVASWWCASASRHSHIRSYRISFEVLYLYKRERWRGKFLWRRLAFILHFKSIPLCNFATALVMQFCLIRFVACRGLRAMWHQTMFSSTSLRWGLPISWIKETPGKGAHLKSWHHLSCWAMYMNLVICKKIKTK